MKTRAYLAELIGSAVLLLAVVGSSYMAADLTDDQALALLINALVTAAVLLLIIKSAHPHSGSHFNPAVTVALLIQGKISVLEMVKYILSQFSGAFLGVVLANLMFTDGAFKASEIARLGNQQLLGEAIATAGLVFLALHLNAELVWKLVPLWIFAAYFFTTSTSFANPAVTVARHFTDAPAGISLDSIPGFVLIQIVSAVVIGFVFRLRK